MQSQVSVLDGVNEGDAMEATDLTAMEKAARVRARLSEPELGLLTRSCQSFSCHESPHQSSFGSKCTM